MASRERATLSKAVSSLGSSPFILSCFDFSLVTLNSTIANIMTRKLAAICLEILMIVFVSSRLKVGPPFDKKSLQALRNLGTQNWEPYEEKASHFFQLDKCGHAGGTRSTA
jgi:hypothetical protein